MEALIGTQPSPEGLRINGDRGEERKCRNRIWDKEEEDQEETLQCCQKMSHFCLLQMEGRRGRGKEGMVNKRRKRKAEKKAQLEKCLPSKHGSTSLIPKAHILKVRQGGDSIPALESQRQVDPLGLLDQPD